MTPLAPVSAAVFRRSLWILALLNLLVRLPLVWDSAGVRNDGAEYLAIARGIALRGGYETDLKYHFWTDAAVQHEAWEDRPPLFPLLAAACLAVGAGRAEAVRLGCVVISALAVVLAGGVLARMVGRRRALLLTGYGFLLPYTVYWTAQPMTESLSLLLAFAALSTWMRGRRGSGPAARRWRQFTGLLIGLGILNRPTGALLLAAVLLDLPRTALLSRGWQVLAPALAVIAPYHLVLAAKYGSPVHSSLGYAFAVRDYYAVTYHGFEAARATPLTFLREIGPGVVPLILRQLWQHLQSIVWPLAPLVPLALAPGGPPQPRRLGLGRRRPMLALVTLTLLLHTVTWSAWGSTRYFILILFPLSAWLSLARLRGGRWAGLLRGLSATTALAYLIGGLAWLYWTEVGTQSDRAADRRRLHQAADAVRGARLIASDRPGALNLLTGVSAVMLPRTADTAQFRRFVGRYRPDAVVLFIQEPLLDEARAMAAVLRRHALPPDWTLAVDENGLLIARAPVRDQHRSAPRPGEASATVDPSAARTARHSSSRPPAP